MINRIKGALLLDEVVFEEIEHDDSATGQAAVVVIIAAVLGALGVGFGSNLLQTAMPSSGSAIVNFIIIVVWAIVAWLVWSGVTYFIGTRLFHGEATYGEMLRVTGFGFAPIAFMILSAIPCIGFAISLLVMVWSLGAVFIAVRSGLDLSFGNALVTVLIGWVVYAIGMGIILSLVFGVSNQILSITG
ncbi:MAG: YIP1 family protein [Candidatus Promineifilaceae bacterium]|nr:YIP1 family protein [Candidatus Promineifilaceae bacterium]